MGGMAMVLFLFLASTLLAPAWAVAVLVVVWVGVLVVACRWWTRRPALVPLLPAGLAVLWFAAMNAGGAFLGWSA